MRDTELIKESVVFIDESLRNTLASETRVQGWMIQWMTHRQGLLGPRAREHATGSLDYPMDIIQDLSNLCWFCCLLLADATDEFFRISRDTGVRK